MKKSVIKSINNDMNPKTSVCINEKNHIHVLKQDNKMNIQFIYFPSKLTGW